MQWLIQVRTRGGWRFYGPFETQTQAETWAKKNVPPQFAWAVHGLVQPIL